MAYDIEVLKKICPASESAGEKAAHSTDSSNMQGNALAVAWPNDYEQIRSLIRFASREEIPLVPRGGGTSLVGGAVPQNAIVVDFSKLNKIRRLFMGDKKVVVQSGVVLDRLNAALAEYDLELPVNPSSSSACTIGGMIATNAAGMHPSGKRFMKEWIINLTLLDGAGRVYTLDGNEAKRFCGSEGCCGFVIEATLKLDEKKESSTDVFEFSDFQSLYKKVLELKNDKDASAICYINSKASNIVGFKGSEMLLVRYNSGKGSIDPVEAEALWHKYDNLHSLLVNAGYPRAEDPSFEKDVDKFLDWINKQGIPCYGKIAVGSVHPYLKSEQETERIATVVSELKGSMVGEYGVGALRRRYAPFATAHTIRELKSKYDPKGILNKGKVI